MERLQGLVDSGAPWVLPRGADDAGTQLHFDLGDAVSDAARRCGQATSVLHEAALRQVRDTLPARLHDTLKWRLRPGLRRGDARALDATAVFSATDEGDEARARLADRGTVDVALAGRQYDICVTHTLPPPFLGWGDATVVVRDLHPQFEVQGVVEAVLGAFGYGRVRVVREWQETVGGARRSGIVSALVRAPRSDPSLQGLPSHIDIGYGGMARVSVYGPWGEVRRAAAPPSSPLAAPPGPVPPQPPPARREAGGTDAPPGRAAAARAAPPPLRSEHFPPLRQPGPPPAERQAEGHRSVLPARPPRGAPGPSPSGGVRRQGRQGRRAPEGQSQEGCGGQRPGGASPAPAMAAGGPAREAVGRAAVLEPPARASAPALGAGGAGPADGAPPVPSEVREHWRQRLENSLDTPNTRSGQSEGRDAWDEIVQHVWESWGCAQDSAALYGRAAHQRLARAAAVLNTAMHDVDGNVRSPPAGPWAVAGRREKRTRSPPGRAGDGDGADRPGGATAPDRPYNTRRHRATGPWYASGVGSQAAGSAASLT